MMRYTCSFYLNDDRNEKALVDGQGLYFAYTFRTERSQKLEEQSKLEVSRE